MNTLKIKTGNGIYEIRKPGGRLGAKNMVILSKLAGAVSPSKPLDPEVEDPAVIAMAKAQASAKQMDLFGIVFEEWAEKILPALVVSGPFTYDEMPGEDQLAVFLALTQETQVADDFFQVVPPEPSQ
jgi:hypothetical protein